MQSYVLNLTAAMTRAFDLKADLFVYESGATTPADGDTRIRVKPDTGAEIILRPGQRFRLAPGAEATHWEVSALDKTVTLSGYVIIGSGEFDDANTLNKVTLDATFANQVTVTNSPANRVNVALDPNYTLGTTAPIMAYTNSKSNIQINNGATVTLLTPAENVNGIILEQITGLNGSGYNVLAKTSFPASGMDGDVLAYSAPILISTRIKVPAGKGVYVANGSATVAYLSALYTVL